MALELKLKEGDQAPGFKTTTSGGGCISLSDLAGKPVVLYFYPKDDTPGCTKQACGIRDSWKDFQESGAEIFGVSVDSVQKHDKFIKKYELPFTLLSDGEKNIVQDYGVWGEKKFMGREYMGTHRVTFLIDGSGVIRKIWPKVKPEEHAADVLKAIAEL
ncbi:MAG: thioredoxin-dependent thiol peroxidase [Opitutales bacterium]|nr:thioredoxin-dependent thiol peroxidase [Opitutales bacterium]